MAVRLTEPLLEVLYAHRRSMTDFDRCECGYERESIMPPGRWIDHQVREVAAVLAGVLTEHEAPLVAALQAIAGSVQGFADEKAYLTCVQYYNAVNVARATLAVSS